MCFRSLSPGSIEVAVIFGKKRCATVRAATMLICYTLDGDAWDRVLGSFDYLKVTVRSHRGVFFFFSDPGFFLRPHPVSLRCHLLSQTPSGFARETVWHARRSPPCCLRFVCAATQRSA